MKNNKRKISLLSKKENNYQLNKEYLSEKYKYPKKIIDYYLEIESYKKDLNCQQKKIKEIIMKIFDENKNIDILQGEYCKVEKNIDIKLSNVKMREIEILKKFGLLSIITIDRKKFTDYMEKYNEDFDIYKEYFTEKDINRKRIIHEKLIERIIENNNLKILTIDVNKLKESKYYGDENIQQIIKKRETEKIKFDIIK